MNSMRSILFSLGALVLMLGTFHPDAWATYTFGPVAGGGTNTVQFNIALATGVTLRVNDAQSLDGGAGTTGTTLDAVDGSIDITGFVPNATCSGTEVDGHCVYVAAGGMASQPGAWAVAAIGLSMDYAGCSDDTGTVGLHYTNGNLTQTPPKACDNGNGTAGGTDGTMANCAASTWAASTLTPAAGHTNLTGTAQSVAATLNRANGETAVIEVGAFIDSTDNVSRTFNVILTGNCSP